MNKRLITKVLFIAMMLVCWCVLAQKPVDSAAIVINNYLKNLGHDALNWQTVDMTSVITFNNASDTLLMERRFAFPEYSYVRVSQRGKTLFGLYSDGNEFLRYDTTRLSWDVTSESEYLRQLSGYDPRGPLWNWENMSIEAQYRGISLMEGNPVCRVAVRDPLRGLREYLFELPSGNLFLTVEQQPADPQAPHVDWRAIHEYTPVGDFLFPTLESYQSQGTITIIATRVELMPFKKSDFQRPPTIHEYY